MNRTAVWFAVIAGLTLSGGWSLEAQAKKQIRKVSATPTRLDSGVEMFKAYCAACHGADGKGQGPAAEALKVPPADLTLLKQKNGGKYPSHRVSVVIEGSDDVRAHGSSEMPLWGPIFRSMDPNNAAATKLRINNLVKYVETLQQ